MITFKQFLNESRSAPLYHATTMKSAVKILSDNILYGTKQDNGRAKDQTVIFTTRSLIYAKYLAREWRGVAFVLNQQRINQRYKITPIKNWGRKRGHKPMYMSRVLGGNEFEEIIIANKIPYITDYITKIIYKDSAVDSIDEERISKIAEEYNIPIETFK